MSREDTKEEMTKEGYKYLVPQDAIDDLIGYLTKFHSSKNPLAQGQAYILGNWWYENYPDIICPTMNIIRDWFPQMKNPKKEIERIITMQKTIHISGIPTIKEEIKR